MSNAAAAPDPSTPAPTPITPGVELNEAPDSPAAAPAPAPAPAEADPAAEQKALEAKIRDKTFKDDVRSQIAAKRTAMTLEERQAFAKEDPDQAALGDAIAGHTDEESEEEETPAAAVPAPGAPAPAPAAPVAQSGKKYKLTVYGKDAGEVDESTVIDHGIRALQKEHAADVRMGQVATREAQLTKWQQDLQHVADNLSKGLDHEGRPLQPAGGSAHPQPPTGVAGVIDKAKLKEAQNALLRGDDDASADMLATIIQEAVAAGRPAAPAAEPRKVEVPKLPTQPSAATPWDETQRREANQIAQDEFVDLSDAQFALMRNETNRLMADTANQGRALKDLVREAGATVRRAIGGAPTPPPAPAPAMSPAAAEQARRGTLKARLPVVTPPGSARAPTSMGPAPTYPTNSEYVRQLQMRNGNNSSPRR